MNKPPPSSQKKPDVSELINTAVKQCELGHFEEALASLNQAISLDSVNAIAYLNRGYTHLAMGNWQAMAADLNRAKELDPTNADIHYKIGVMLSNGKDYITAIPALNSAIQYRPGFEDAWTMLADCYYRIGSYETAQKIYQEVEKKFPKNLTAKLELAYMLPPIPFSQEAIDAARAGLIQNLDRLMQKNFAFASPEKDIKYFPFFQAYHGRNNKEMAQKIGDFFYKSYPDMAFTAPHVSLPQTPKQKIHIGFVLDFAFKNVLSQFFLALIEGLSGRNDFEVLLIVSGTGPDNPEVKQLAAKINKYIVIPASISLARQAIAAEKLDILVYTEIGMVRQSYFLAMAKLAPIQCFWGGHPVTSGLPTMDYYISSPNFEPKNSQEHHSEKILLFERLPSVFKRPAMPQELPSRQQLGLPGDGNLYCCPVMLFKLHPDMDAIFAGILKRDHKARIILFDSHHKTLYRPSLEKRFAAHMPKELSSRIVFIPYASKEKFFQILLNVDAIIDTVHFSFGTTALLALGLNLPFVTMPGEFSRGRQSYAFYKQMEVIDLVAATPEEYIELAVRLANDKEFKAGMVEKIRAHSDQLFDDYAMVDNFAERMKELYSMLLK